MFALTHNFADSAWGSVLVTSWTFNTKPLRLPVSADRGGLHPVASRGGVPCVLKLHLLCRVCAVFNTDPVLSHQLALGQIRTVLSNELDALPPT